MDLNTKMLSIAVVDDQKVDILESRLPLMDKDDILVRIRGCMLCTFEQRIFNRVVKTPLPFVAGHEIVGEVAEIGDDIDASEWTIGQKVVIRLLNDCGECYFCRRNRPNLCIKGNETGKKNEILGMGGLGQYISVKARQLWKISKDIEDSVAAFSEPLACVVNSVQRGNIHFGDDVLVIGGGIMGQLHVILAKLQGARVILSEPNEERRIIAEQYGADFTVNPLEVDLKQYIYDKTGNGAEVVFVAVAPPKLAKQALELVAPTGSVVLYSSIHPDEDILFNPNYIHKTETVITGAVSPTIQSFDAAVNLLTKGLVDPLTLVHAEYPFNAAQKAFEEAIKPESMRVLIKFVEE